MKGTTLDSSVPDDDDIFGTTRSYGSSFLSAKPRPTMISAKYRLKEERRKVLKISINKLKKIEDPESSLRRSVLINNTMKRLQKEARDEKIQKHSPYTRTYVPYKSRSSSEFSKDEDISLSETEKDSYLLSPSNRISEFPNNNESDKENSSPFKFLSSFTEKKTAPPSEMDTGSYKAENQSPRSLGVLTSNECVAEETPTAACTNSFMETDKATIAAVPNPEPTSRCASRKRSYDEVEDCDVHDVLSQFYMPPTPRLLTSLDDTDDEDEDVNVVDIDTVPPELVPLTSDISSNLSLSSSSSIQSLQLPAVQPSCHSNLNLSTSSSNLAQSFDIINSKRAEFDSSSCQMPSCIQPEGSNSLSLNIAEHSPPIKRQKLEDGLETSVLNSNSDSSLFPSESGLRISNDCEIDDDSIRDIEFEEKINEVICSKEFEECCKCTKVNSDSRTCSTCVDKSKTESANMDSMLVDSSCVDRSLNCEQLLRTEPSHMYFENRVNERRETDGISFSGSREETFISSSNEKSADRTSTYNPSVPSNCPTNNSLMDTDHQYSCGHSSIFSELQSVVFHSLITSLES